jgi:hypothetical protein
MFIQEILRNTRTETFAGTLVIRMVRWSGAIVLMFLQTFLGCLTLFHIMEASQAVHIHLDTRLLISGTVSLLLGLIRNFNYLNWIASVPSVLSLAYLDKGLLVLSNIGSL